MSNPITLQGIYVYRDFFLKWLDEIMSFYYYYCLKNLHINDNFKIEFKLKKCDDNEVENYVFQLSNDKFENELKYTSLKGKGIGRDIILCYNLDKDKKISCWMKSKEGGARSRLVKICVDVEKHADISIGSIIYLYYDDNEYYLIYDDKNNIIKKISNNSQEDYTPIENIIKARDQDALRYFEDAYNNTKNKYSIVDIALDLGINECEFYRSIYPFTIVASNPSAHHYILAEIPETTKNISDNEKNEKKNKLERILSICFR